MERKIIDLKFKKLSEKAQTPTYGTDGAACMDVYAIEDYTLSPRIVTLVRTGLAFEVPEGYEMQIRPRSGLAVKHQLIVLNSPGTLDSDYRGELMVGMKNISNKHYVILEGDRIAQIVLKEVPLVVLHEVDELSDTDRAEGGFGHTGK